MDEGIDTGDIILQRTFPISENDNYSTLLERAYVYCADILYDALKELKAGTTIRRMQSTYDKFDLY